MFGSRKLRSGLLSVGIKIYGKVSSSSGKHIRLLEEIKKWQWGKRLFCFLLLFLLASTLKKFGLYL